MLEFIHQELESLKKSGLYREPKTIEKMDGSHITIAGREYLLFCSNNYLGLANHPKVIQKSIEIIKEFGFGAGASRLISGNTVVHEELESRIASLKGREAAIVFPTGYMANLGVITSLVDENDTIISDRLNHASILDACRLSKAKLQVYPHKNTKILEEILKRSDKYKKRLIVTDSVFSMDGDIAPLAEIAKTAKKYNAITMIDDAHATGVLGNGHGAEAHFKFLGMKENIDVVMGTLSKALGSIGGFIAGSHDLIDYLRNKARSFIYTTALPVSACAAAMAAMEVFGSRKERQYGQLWLNTEYLRNKLNKLGLNTLESETPIIPVMIGDVNTTMEISQKLFDRGIFLSGIRPPTVPDRQSRLRITLMATHTKEDLECLVSSLQELIPRSARQS